MRKLLSLLAALLLFAPAARAQDAVPIQSVQVVNAPDIRSWPATATITHISVTPDNTRIDFTKRDGPSRWPDIRPTGWTGDMEYTVWLFLQVNGQWVGSGFIQMWNGRDGVGDAPSDYAKNWYYGTRWSPMQTHGVISPTEQIGILVTSGNERDSGGPFGVQERSNLVLIPGADSGEYSFQTPPAPAPTPTPVTPAPVPVPTPVPVPAPTPAPPSILSGQEAILAAIADVKASVEAGREENKTFFASVKTLWQQVGAPFLKYVAPAIAAYLAGKKL